mmetsp:Transcript_106915/g.312611  ORF Transcript_106915/g.312611 Transcript_106915/m.312611 type:complete len:789 (+) Transcript_106915:44-2410(+)
MAMHATLHSVPSPCGKGDDECKPFNVPCGEPMRFLLLRFRGVQDSHYIGVNRVRLFEEEKELSFRVIAADGSTEAVEEAACIGTAGGWWAQVGGEHSLVLELGEDACLSSVRIWCANAGATPRELVISDAKREVPEICAPREVLLAGLRDVLSDLGSPIIHEMRSGCGSGDDQCQFFAVECKAPAHHIAVHFRGIQDSHYIGINRLRIRGAAGELRYKVIAADGSAEDVAEAASVEQAGGWWATCGEEHSLIIELQEAASVTSIGIWCANAGATPKEMHVTTDLAWVDEMIEVLDDLAANSAAGLGPRAKRLIESHSLLLTALAKSNDRLRGALLARVLSGETPRFPIQVDDALGRLQAQLFCDSCRSEQLSTVSQIGQLAGTTWQRFSWPSGVLPSMEESIIQVTSRLLQPVANHGAEWLGTGLYVPPGGSLKISVGHCSEGWSLKVGAHTDDIRGREEWQRWPRVSLDAPLVPCKTITLSTPFGGNLYLVRSQSSSPDVEITCSGNAVRQPHVSLAKGVDAEGILASPGGWVDCEGAKVILTLPVHAVREALTAGADILAALDFYDRLWTRYNDLSPWTDPRPQRIVPDVQTSHGWMHAGYPIMTHFGEVIETSATHPIPRVLDVHRLEKEGNWGLFHEMGHNMQRGSWTFHGTEEVTVNLFTLWGFSQLCEDCTAKHTASPTDFIKAGCPRDKWNSDPFLALRTYAQVIASFGWEHLKATFKRYAEEGNVARNYAEQVRSFVRFWSLDIRCDIRPHWRRWGFEEELQTEDPELSQLEPWSYATDS